MSTRVYATDVKRWPNDHRVAGAAYELPTLDMAEAHVRAGWATWTVAGKRSASEETSAPTAEERPKNTEGRSKSKSTLLVEGDLSALPSTQE